ncbi:MAG TPA: hypothetical protein VFG00_14340 [Acidothermaceae bacterium]|nr:hypothetical protein [Acidothermaceae bacterium]
MSLRERLEALTEHREPVFELSDDPTLVAFSKLFAQSELFALEASKRIRVDAFSTTYDCETETRSDADAAPGVFEAIWTPVWPGEDPLTGFRTGSDSVFGHRPTVAMPQDERTAALLLLVTSIFVHLSASRAEPLPVIRGALDAPAGAYRFVTLDPAVARARVRATRESRRAAARANARTDVSERGSAGR